MTDNLTTKPTLDTLLEMMQGLRDEVRAGFTSVNDRLETLEERLEQLETRMDRVQSIALETRADVRDFKKQFRERARSEGAEEARP